MTSHPPFPQPAPASAFAAAPSPASPSAIDGLATSGHETLGRPAGSSSLELARKRGFAPLGPDGRPADLRPARTGAGAYGLQALRTPWWKGLFSILAIAAVFLVISLALGMASGILSLALELPLPMNWAVLLATNLSWAAMIPLAPLIVRGMHGLPKGAIGSLDGGFRWGRLGRALLWVLPLYLLMQAVGFLVPTAFGEVTPAHLAFAAVALLTTPLQAAGEEFAFRGALTVAAGSWARTPGVGLAVGTLFAALVFAVAHGATDPWLFAYYLCFGLAMAALSIITRGLEAAVAAHAANNVLAFLVASLSGSDLAAGFDRSEGAGGPFMLVPIATGAVAVAIAWILERRRGRAASPDLR